MLYINTKPIEDARMFAFDGCHKIFLIRSERELARMVENGYLEGDAGIYPVHQLPEVWEQTCSLRFISGCGPDYEPFVEQGDADPLLEIADNEGVIRHEPDGSHFSVDVDRHGG